MDDAANAADDERSIRRPHSRQTRRSPYAPTRELMATRSFDALDSSEPESSPPALRRTRSYAADAAPGVQEALNDISINSTSRKPRHPRHHSKSLGIGHPEALENVDPLPDRSVSQPTARNAPRVPSKRARIFGLRSASHKRVDSSDPQKYIESLEAQVASLQTQLQSSSSPSLQRSNSNKLRALNAETKLYRQEVKEWERTFNDRVREQVEQYELVAGSLRARIRFLEKERDAKDQTIEVLESDVGSKSESLTSLEKANRALERRLQATLQQLYGPDHLHTLDTGATETLVLQSPLMTRPLPETPASNRSLPSVQTVSSPLQSRHSRQFSESSTPYDNPFDSGAESSKDSGYVTELASEASEGFSLERPINHSHRPVSWTPSGTGEGLQRSRPSQRRMRRFYTGQTAQSLLLPAARSAGDAPLSAPLPASLSGQQIPVLTSPIRERFPVHSPTSSRGSISLDFRHRSATIDELADPLKSGADRRMLLEQTPRGPIPRHSRTATDGSIMTPDRAGYFGQAQLVRGDRESQGSDTTRPDSAMQHSDSAASDPSTLMQAAPSPSSPLRFAFGPELNIDEVVASPQAQSKTPVRSRRSDMHKGSPRQPRTRIGRMVAQVQYAFEAHVYAARYMFASTWQNLAVARPVLEFRCWLVRVLLGRLRDRGTMFLVRRTAGRASTSNPAGIGLRMGVGSPVALGAPRPLTDAEIDEELLLDVLDEGDIVLPPLAPPVHWLRFSMTLICAVGVAIKDGPATLFPRRATKKAEPPPVHRRGGSLLELLMPAAARSL